MTKLRLAVIGVGHLGKIHAKLAHQSPDVELVAVADPHEAARDVAAQFEVEAVADYRSLFGRIDAAVVAAPTVLHHAISRDLLNSGIHLLVEKPITSTVQQARELCDLARGKKLVLQVGHVERFNPGLSCAAPYLTQPKYIEAARYSGHTFRSTDIGVVLDLMIHDLDIVLSLVQAPLRSVQALGVSVFGQHEDVAQARLEFENGCVANLSASRVSFAPTRHMQVWSERAFVNIDFASRGASVIEPPAALRDSSLDVYRYTAEQKAHLKDHLFEEMLPLRKLEAPTNNAIADEIADFAQSIREGRAPRVTGEDGLRALTVASEIVEAMNAHCWNGQHAGPIGPLRQQPPSILQGPHWAKPARTSAARPHREAS